MSETYQRFLDSMKIDYYKWHDGIGYDLEALAQLALPEREAAEKLLLERGCQDWRDVEALAVLDTPAAVAALKAALRSQMYQVRISAAEKLAQHGHITAQDVENILLDTIPYVTILNGLTFTFRLAEQYPSEAVRRAILKTAMYGQDDARVHAAALAEYLYGVSKAAFDWDRHDFYLRFNEKDSDIRWSAYIELCRNVHSEPV